MPKKKTALTIEERLQQALVPAEKQPYEVPENWVWVRLGEVNKYISKSVNPVSEPDKIFELYSVPSMVDNYPEIIAGSDIGSSKQSVCKKDVLLCKINPRINRVWKVSQFTDNELIASSEWIIIRNNHIDANYLMYCFQSKYFREFMLSNVSGVGGSLMRAQPKYVQTYPIPLPPLSEQQRIVERIEELFAKLDEAKERLQEVVDSFAVRKAAILHKAFTGELTKQWRLENGVSDESWEEITWGSFIEKIEAGKNWNALGRPPKNGEFGVVKVSAVTWGEFLEDESKTCTEESQWNEEKRISVGDFLFSRANTIQLVGNCVIVKDVKRKLMLSDKILRFSFSERVYDFFALWYTRTSSYRKQIESVASGNQDGMRNISQNNMKTIIFPLPTLSEQHEIVRLIDDLLARERAGAFKAGAGGKLKLNKNQDLGSGKS